MKRILLAAIVPLMASGCVVQTRPKYVQPAYVATCPAGYRYDGNTCVRIPQRNAHVRVDYYR